MAFLGWLPKSLVPFVVLSVNWLVQGIIGLDKIERNFKLFLDIFLTSIFYFILIQFISVSQNIIVAFIISHTLNWIFNTNVHAVRSHYGGTRIEINDFVKYLRVFSLKVQKQKGIECAAAFGSFSQKRFDEFSDLDITVYQKPGLVNCIMTCLFVMFERSKAFLMNFPLDIYILNDITKHKSIDEEPIILYDPNQKIKMLHNKTIDLEGAIKSFLDSDK
ncbi:hypothetical protein [Methanosarcina acetivorans]|nr:hypothetical protein [Methanosarcina acetivorans]